MYPTDRRAMIIAILLGALTILFLSACDVTQGSAHAALGATTTTNATSASGATEAPAASATAPAASATATPIPPQGTAVPTTTAPTALPATPAPSPTEMDDTDPFTDTDDLTDTGGLTSTTTLTETQPVAQAIADFFGVSVTEVLTLHQEGLGFGEIARAYFLARELAADGDPANDLTAAQILAMHQGGMGWGRIVAALGLPHGNSGRNLGLIMRRHKHDDQGDDGSEASATAPGQPKHNGDSHGGGNGHGHGKDKGHDHGKK